MVVSFLVLDATMRNFWNTAFPFWNMPISRMEVCYQEYSSAGRIVPHSDVTYGLHLDLVEQTSWPG